MVNETNLELQGVLDHFNLRLTGIPGGVIDTSSDTTEGYILGEYSGKLGFKMELDIDYKIDHSSAGDIVHRIRRLGSPNFLEQTLQNSDLVANVELAVAPINSKCGSLAEQDKYVLKGYNVLGDSVVEVTKDAWMDSVVAKELDSRIPEKYRKILADIKEGADARRVIDAGFDLYEWDNEM